MGFGTALQRTFASYHLRIYGTILFFVLAAAGLLVFETSRPQAFEDIRMHVIDTASPLLDAAASASRAVSEAATIASGVFDLAERNAVLREENDRLIRWHHQARELEAENRRLRALLGVVPDAPPRSITARVIGDSGSAFVRSLLVNAGDRDGIRSNMAAMTGRGLAGRVISTGRYASRVLLLTDLNSRIPVLVGERREPAILAGNNSRLPSLHYLQYPEKIPPRAAVVTSGHGGLFPHGLPIGEVVGRVTSTGPSGAAKSVTSPEAPASLLSVRPFADLRRIEFLRLVARGPVDNAAPADDAASVGDAATAQDDDAGAGDATTAGTRQ